MNISFHRNLSSIMFQYNTACMRQFEAILKILPDLFRINARLHCNGDEECERE